MNCANHPDIPRSAFCRTCGKALCANCSRNVRGVIYCEDCLAARVQGAPAGANVPPAIGNTANPPTGQPVRSLGSSGPNPALAGILGAIPFGIGAVYNGQYAKALAHLGIFVGLVWGLNAGNDHWAPVLGIGMAFFVVYQIIDAVRSARAIQMGMPAPDPFGLGQAFGTGEKVDTSTIPVGAVVLIALGALFLLQTLDIPFLNFDRVLAFVLIALGVWLFAKRQGLNQSRGYPRAYALGTRGNSGPVVLVTIGVLFLIQSFDGPGFGRTWPVLLLVIGLSKLLNAKTPAGPPPNLGGMPPLGPDAGTPAQTIEPPSSEVHNG